MDFQGTYEHTLDAKNRLTIPAKFRSTLATGVVLAKGIEACVTVWAADGFRTPASSTRSAGTRACPPKRRDLQRCFTSTRSSTSSTARAA